MRFTQREVNLHTHTVFSHHGKGMPSDYLREAERDGNIKVLGFSEHVPLEDTAFPQERLRLEEVPLYIKSVRELESESVTVLLSMECDFLPEFIPYFEDVLIGKWGCDYLLGSVHYLPDENGVMKYVGKPSNTGLSLPEYVTLYTGMLSSGLFLYGCHPDLFASIFPEWNEETKAAARDIIACARECDMPLEINGNGFRKGKKVLSDGSERLLYPIAPFWEMARDEGVRVVTASDAHRPGWVDGWSLAEEFASPLGIRWAEYELDSERKKISIV